MLLRRVTEHFKSQNWTAIGIDFLIVVLGVFMGLQVQQWNEQRSERSKEQAYLERLASDFTAIDQQLELCLTVYEDSVEATNYVSGIVRESADFENGAAPDSRVFSAALIRLTAGTIPAGRSATFVEMISSGDLSILRNSALRKALIAYDERAQINREIWRSTRDETGEYQRPLYENIDLLFDLNNENYATVQNYDLEAMISDRDFRTMLNVLAGSKANNYELCRYQRTLTEVARKTIEQSSR